MDNFIRKTEALKEYAGVATLLLASAGFIVAYLQALMLARGQASIANYILSEVGVTAMWTSSLVLVLGSVIQTIFLILLFKTKGDFSNKYGLAFGSMAWVLVWNILPLIFFATLLASALFVLLLRKYLKKKTSLQRNQIRSSFFAVAFLSWIYLGIFYYPTLPHSILQYKNGHDEIVQILATKDNKLIVSYGKTKQIKTVDIKDVDSTSLCEDKAWYSYTFPAAIDKSLRPLPECPEKN